MFRSFLRAPLFLFVVAMLLSACQPALPTPTAKAKAATATLANTATPLPSATPSPSPEVTVPVRGAGLEKDPLSFPADVNPLTDLPVADPVILERRPVAVKISNYPRSVRPQWGLSLADIVYEYYHNNDLTRFYAIFYGQRAPLAGPIRSGRLFDSILTDIYQSILVFASADYRVLARLDAKHPAWQLIGLLGGGDCPPRPVCRFEPEARDYLLTDTDAAGDYAAARGENDTRPELRGMTFAAQPPAGGETVPRIYTYYSYSAYSYWDYDPDSVRYLRYQDTQEDLGLRNEAYAPLTDRLNGQQIAADNVVVLYVPHFHFYYRPATDAEPAIEVVDMDFSGHGPAYAFRDGLAYELEWVLEDGQVVYLVDANGERFPFKPGTTWFEVMHEDSRLIPGKGNWRFEFVFRRP
ncbi:MAG: DUF3048 domain-containing protein [Anaerolineales bacterium]